MSESFVAARPEIEWQVNDGHVRAKVDAVRRDFHAATGGMSNDALRLAVAQEKLDKALVRHGASSTQAKQAELGYRRELQNSTTAAHRHEQAVVQDTRALVRHDRAADRSTHSLRALRSAALFTASAFIGAGGLAYGLQSAVRTSLDFERGMRNVNSIAKLSEGELENLSERVLDLAGPVAQAPKTLATGLYDLESSGFKANDAIEILAVSSKAATAGLTEASVSTKAIAAALNAYHYSADKARGVSDILFTTVDKGVITFDELAQNMGDLVPAAAPLGVRLEEVGAAIATITLQGVPGAEAATRVKNSLILLAKPSKELAKLLADAGYESGEAAVKGLGYAGVLQLINDKTGGSVTATAALAPEIRALLGVVGLTGKNLAVYESNLRAMDEAQEGAGRTAAVFAEQSKSGGFELQRLHANVDVLKIKLAGGLNPAIADVTDRVSDWLEKDGNIERVQRDVNRAVATGEEAARGLAEGLDAVRAVAEPVVNALGGIDDAAKTFLILGLALKLRGAAAAFGLLPAASSIARTKVIADMAAMETAAAGTAGRLGRLRRLALPAAIVGGAVAAGQVGGGGKTAESTANAALTGALVGSLVGTPGLGAAAAVFALAGDRDLGATGHRQQMRDLARRILALPEDQREAAFERHKSTLRRGLTDGEYRVLHAAVYRHPVRAAAPTSGSALERERQEQLDRRRRQHEEPSTRTERTPRPTPPKRLEFKLPYALELAEAKAATTATDRDDFDVYRRQRAEVQRQIASGRLTKAGLLAAYAELARVQNDIKAIVDAREAEVDKRQKEAADKARKRAAARAAAKLIEDRRADAEAIRRAEAAKEPDAFMRAVNAEKAAAAVRKLGPSKDASPGVNVPEILRAFKEIHDRYAPNFAAAPAAASGKTDTRLYEAVHELRQQTAILGDMRRSSSFPASSYAAKFAEVVGG